MLPLPKDSRGVTWARKVDRNKRVGGGETGRTQDAPAHLPIREDPPGPSPPTLPALTRTRPGKGLNSDKRRDGLESARKYNHFQENYIVV